MVDLCDEALGDMGHMASSGPLFVSTDATSFTIDSTRPFSLNFTLLAAHQFTQIAVRQFGPVDTDFFNNLQLSVLTNLL